MWLGKSDYSNITTFSTVYMLLFQTVIKQSSGLALSHYLSAVSVCQHSPPCIRPADTLQGGISSESSCTQSPRWNGHGSESEIDRSSIVPFDMYRSILQDRSCSTSQNNLESCLMYIYRLYIIFYTIGPVMVTSTRAHGQFATITKRGIHATAGPYISRNT